MADKVKPGAKPEYFWSKILNKRKNEKLNRRESAIPKAPMSAQDRLNLIIAGAIIVAIPIIFVVLSAISNRPVKAAPGSPPATEESK